MAGNKNKKSCQRPSRYLTAKVSSARLSINTRYSKIAVILLMYAGRIGSLTVFLAVAKTNLGAKLRDPVGKIILG